MRLVVLLFLIAAATCVAQPTPISGIINAYAAVEDLAHCGRWVRVDSADPFAALDRVLLIQMAGARLDSIESPLAGQVLDIGSAGHYEFTTIEEVRGDTVVLREQLLRDYDVTGRVQLVRVPRYEDVIVSAPIVAQPWNGRTGGIVALEATGTLTLADSIVADTCGFRGAWVFYPMHIGTCDVFEYLVAPDSGKGGAKGEGIGELAWRLRGGRGLQANGGGGGNETNAGGGGGGNGGAGGIGGDQWSGCAIRPLGGLGGAPTTAMFDTPVLLMAGGGGSGHGNDWLESGGADGGGIIILRARALDGAGNVVSARGGNGHPAGHDGAGGGGAGGTVVLDVDTVLSALKIDVRGGRGADVAGPLGCHGPGGGGGGGAVLVTGAQVSALLTIDLDPGDPGLTTFPRLECQGTPYGARAGEPGIVRASVPIVESHSYPILSLPRIAAAPGDRVELPVTLERRTDFAFRAVASVHFTVATPRKLFQRDELPVIAGTGDSPEYQFATFDRSLETATESDTIAILRGYALLADVPSAPLEFTSVTYDMVSAVANCPPNYGFVNGQIDVSTCVVGSERRIRIGVGTALRSMVPNPASGTVLCIFDLVEDGVVQLDLIDPVGNPHALAGGRMSAGAHSLNLDVGRFPAGRYVLRLVTPTEIIDGVLVLTR